MSARINHFLRGLGAKRRRSDDKQTRNTRGDDNDRLLDALNASFGDYPGFNKVGDAFKLLGFLGVAEGMRNYHNDGDDSTPVKGRTVRGHAHHDKFKYIERLSRVGINASLESAPGGMRVSIEPESLMKFLIDNQQFPKRSNDFIRSRDGYMRDLAVSWSGNNDSPLLGDANIISAQGMIEAAKARNQQKEDKAWEAAPIPAARTDHPRINPSSPSGVGR